MAFWSSAYYYITVGDLDGRSSWERSVGEGALKFMVAVSPMKPLAGYPLSLSREVSLAPKPCAFSFSLLMAA